MIYNFLSLLFFCGVCVSAFGQELQSPQINQNAIFANPGLAGSKGCLRINTSTTYLNDLLNHSLVDQNYKFQHKIINTLISTDGLIWKNRIGIAGYFKNETNRIYDQYFHKDSSSQEYEKTQAMFNYHNIYAGFMIAPKFYIDAKDPKKLGRTLSPAVGIGFKATQLTYTGDDTLKNTSTRTPLLYNGFQTDYVSLDYLSLGILYSSPKNYIGLKVNFKQFKETFFLSDLSIVVAKSFYNKRTTKPNFSFNPQLYLAIPMNQIRRNYSYQNYYGWSNSKVLSSSFCLNLDFRYKKFLFGSFIDVTNHNGVFLGITTGMQLENMKLSLNYSHSGSKINGSMNGLFLSANFYIKAKKERYR